MMNKMVMLKKTASSTVLFSLLAISSLTAFAADWPQWRGPNRDGKSPETGLLKSWPEGGPALSWKTTGLGAGYSGISLVGDKMFTMGDVDGSSQIMALNAADGKKLWSTKMGKPGGGGGYPGPRCTPAFDNGLLYAIDQNGNIICVEANTGKEIWRKNLIADFKGEMMSGWGYSESPLIDGNQVICTPGGNQGAIIALDKKTGETIWQSKEYTDKAAYSSVVLVEIDGVRQYIQLTGSSVGGVAAKDGKLLWRAPRAGRTAVIPTPIYRDNQVYVTSGYGVGCNSFKITSENGVFKAEEVYKNTTMVNHHGGVILIGDHLYGFSDGKGWVCQEFKTGKQVWGEKTKLGKGAVTYADGHLYLRSESGRGTIVLLEASPTGYVEKGRFDQPERSDKNSWPHPVICNGKLFIRDQDVLLCYDIKQK